MYRSNIIHSYAQRLLSMILTLTALMGSLCYPYSEINGKTRPHNTHRSRSKKPAGQQKRLATNKRMQQFYQLPMSFELNRGQTDSEVKFLSRGKGYMLFLTATESILSLRRGANEKPAVLRTSFVGANRNPQIAGQNELPGKVNYMMDQDPEGWRSNVSTYAKVLYEEVYPGVDMVYYGNQRQLEYDFIVEPHSNPKTIRLAFTGARSLTVDAAGDLVLETAAGTVRQKRPVAYQEINGQRQTVTAKYVVKNQRQAGFELGTYDRSQPLVIDPVIDYSTYLGGTGDDEANDIVVDNEGNIYVTGVTGSVNFPPKNALKASCLACQNWGFDAFVTKINPNEDGEPSLVFSTFWGSNTHGNTEGRGIDVDLANNIYVVGTTNSNNFPTTPNALQPAYQMFSGTNSFLTKFNAQGNSFLYSTYLMGNNVDEAGDVAVDDDNNIYVAGATGSTNFPLMNAYQAYNAGIFDGFLMKFHWLRPDPGAYELVYSTYFGGYETDMATNIALDSAGNAYLTGSTQSRDLAWTPQYDGLPVLNGFQMAHAGGTDAFVMKFDPTKPGLPSLLYSTYLGGSGQENAAVRLGGIAVDNRGDAYVTGTTGSVNFPLQGAFKLTPGGYDTFVTKVSPDAVGASSLIYSTFLGGAGLDYGYDIAVDLEGRAYVVGMTQSNDFQITDCAFSKGASWDGFIAVLNPLGSNIEFLTYLGGNSVDSINAIAVDASSVAHVTGSTYSTDFRLKDAYQGGPAGSKDAFVTRIIPIGCAP
ncbi:MAG TPA: SBBP repeat-containing protein [Pyrinomonadaceae bacterium]|nr:SBBP repeat-containing protein [Pyrinomonadaceae bacterium]